MTSGFATVKGVTSGDTLLLVGRAAAGPPPELQLTLSGVAAPRLAKGSNAVDEPFAWAARDFLRRLALGKAVSFRVDGEAAGRSFGAAWLKTGAGEPESLARFLARAGGCLSRRRRPRAAAATTRARAGGGRPRAAKLGAPRATAGATARPVDGLRRGRWRGRGARSSSTSRRVVPAMPRVSADAPHAEMAVVGVRLAGVRCGRVPFAPAGGGGAGQRAAAPRSVRLQASTS